MNVFYERTILHKFKVLFIYIINSDMGRFRGFTYIAFTVCALLFNLYLHTRDILSEIEDQDKTEFYGRIFALISFIIYLIASVMLVFTH